MPFDWRVRQKYFAVLHVTNLALNYITHELLLFPVLV